MAKPRIAVHKFSSCDGCQLALLNLGDLLLDLPKLVEIVHFVEAGPVDETARVEVALVEGSISTPEDLERISMIRENSRYLIAIGACATTGGLQSLRNMADAGEWLSAIYASPEHIQTLDKATAISGHVKVDLALWGCPVNSGQVLAALRDLLSGVKPRQDSRVLCQECKRRQVVCTLVSKGEPCMGPVTKAGCGAICPAFGRACYACYGPSEQVNHHALARCFEGLGLMPAGIARRFGMINSQAPAYLQAAAELEMRR